MNLNGNTKRRKEIRALINLKRDTIKLLEREIDGLWHEYFILKTSGYRIGVGRTGELPFGLMSIRLSNALKQSGLKTWKQVRSISSIDLYKIICLGKRSIFELEEIAGKKMSVQNPNYHKINKITDEIYGLHTKGVGVKEIAEKYNLKESRVRCLINKACRAGEHNTRHMIAYENQK